MERNIILKKAHVLEKKKEKKKYAHYFLYICVFFFQAHCQVNEFLVNVVGRQI
jgi:hypothetical protein